MYETRTGTSQYGICSYCGADKVLNQKTGKTFCSEKCWLPANQRPQQLGNPLPQPDVDETIEKMRLWSKGVTARMNLLEDKVARLEKEIKELSNLKTLMYSLAPKESVDLHSSMSGSTSEEIANDLGGKVMYEDIPVIK